MSNSSLVNVTVWAHSGNYSPASKRTKITKIYVHHMAAKLTAQQCGSIFAKAGRNGSTHYGVGSDGKVGLYVDESCVAWAVGVWKENQCSISIETSNSSTGGDWPVSDLTFNKLVELVADIAKRNNLGTLVVGQNLLGHKDSGAATICPGPYLYAKLQELADRANAINNGATNNSDGFLPSKGYWTKGDRDDRVAILADWMRAKYPDITPEAALGNYYGDNIASAIRSYQQKNSLEADGNTGPLTYASLKANGFTYPNPIYPTTEPAIAWEPMTNPRVMITNKDTKLVNLKTKEVVKTYSAGINLECDQKTTVDGILYLRTKYSSSKSIDNGFAYDELREVAAIEPAPEQPVEPTPETGQTTEPTAETGKEDGGTATPITGDQTVSILEKIIEFIKHIIELITKKEN